MGRGSRRSLVCGTRLRGRRPQLEIVHRRDRPGGLLRIDCGVLRDQDTSIGSVWPSSIRCGSRQTAAPSPAGRGMARGTRPTRCDPLRRRGHHRRAHRSVRSGVLTPVDAPIPARPVPMPPKVRGVGGHRDVMTDATEDLVVAARADVDLGGLVRLHPSHLDNPEPSVPQAHRYPSTAHSSKPTTARTAAATIR